MMGRRQKTPHTLGLKIPKIRNRERNKEIPNVKTIVQL